ncbi:MAG: hypothetical protein Q9209_000845 [Squamulea sp. 1 TL-2023]
MASLHGATSLDRHPNVKSPQQAHLQPPTSSRLSQTSDQTLLQKIYTLGIHDGSPTLPTDSIAFVDFNVFPQSIISNGSLIVIRLAAEADLAGKGNFVDSNNNASLQGLDTPQLRTDGSTHLFVVQAMGSDTVSGSSGAQVEAEVHQASHVEITFRDEYLSRSDMWRLIVSELAGRMVYRGQRLAFMGTIKVAIKAIYIRGRRVASAIFSASTKPIFRSESARYVLFIQMSKEMWDFDTDGTGEIMFDKVVNGFLPDLFKRWQRINARHLVTIVMFTRLELNPIEQAGPLSFWKIAVENAAAGTITPRDFYRVVVSDMPSGEWSDILVQLKKEFRVFLKDISIHTSCFDPTVTDQSGSSTLQHGPSQIICGNPSPALRGNILEAVNLASSQFSCDYIDRDLVRTGVSVIVITAGTGLFEVDYSLLATTTDNLIENGVGIDLVCLSRLPLHSVPLFKYCPTPQHLPQKVNQTPQANEQPSDDSTEWLNESDEQPIECKHGSQTTTSRMGTRQNNLSADWNYGIPHWIDVSFWTSPGEGSDPSALSTTRHRHSLTRGVQLHGKPFVPRLRMYELQMMGVMENSIDKIRLPLLPKLKLQWDRTSTAPSSLPRSTTSNDHHSSFYGGSVLRRMAEGSPHTLSSSVTSRRNFLTTHQPFQYRWMDDYDAMLFSHPRQRLAAARNFQPSSTKPSAEQMEQQRHCSMPGSGFQISTGGEQLSKSQYTADLSLPDRALQERTNTVAQPSPSTTYVAKPAPILRSQAPRLSRRISLGFRGFRISTPKATASTDISVEHANVIMPPKRQDHAVSEMNKTHAGFFNSKLSTQKPDRKITTTYSTEPSHGISSARSILVQNPTQIRESSEDSHMQIQYNFSRQTHQQGNLPSMSQNPQQADGLLSQPATPTEDQPMSPRTVLAPWLTVINPSNPPQTGSDLTSRLGRWQHIFPKKLRASKIKWKSLCSPAAIPLTTEVFPSSKELATEYESLTYKINLRQDEELSELPQSHHWLIRELMAFRFSQGFQVVVGSRLAESLDLPSLERFNVFNDAQLTQTDTVIIMTKGSMIHKMTTTEFGQVHVECLTRWSITPQTAAPDDKSEIYQPMIRTMLAQDYAEQSIAIVPRQPKLDWKVIDSCIAGDLRQDSVTQTDDLRSWRARLVLIPVPPASNTQLPFPSRSEDTEEELRLEGIKKLTQMWQRFRYVPPSERRFQTSSTRRRKDDNPLDIMYQTKNPSDIVATEKENMGEEVSSGKAVQLLPESELFQRSNLNLPLLAQTIQGEKGVRMMDRRWHLILHYNCFIGFELTSWLLQNFKDVDSREEAVELGNDLMQTGLFVHVKGRHTFRDGNYFYQVASEYRSARPESRNSWFGSRRADRSIPSTPISEGPGRESPKAPGSRSSSTEISREDATATSTDERQQLGVVLSKSLLYDVDHRRRSYRPELITLHYDRLHNPDNCYHIRIDWLNVTSKFIEDAIVSWAASVEKFGLKLVEVPLAEASAITSMHPFRAPALVKLAKSPPLEHPPTTLFDSTSFTPQAKIEKHYFQKEVMKKFDFILDFEAASDFPLDVDVTYSWGKPDYRYPQYVHRSGTLLAQINHDGDFLLLANRLYNNRNPGAPDAARPDGSLEREGLGKSNRFGSARHGTYRGSPRISPYSSPQVCATTNSRAPPTTNVQATKGPSTFATPEGIKKKFEDFCADTTALAVFYTDVVRTASMPPPSTPKANLQDPRGLAFFALRHLISNVPLILSQLCTSTSDPSPIHPLQQAAKQLTKMSNPTEPMSSYPPMPSMDGSYPPVPAPDNNPSHTSKPVPFMNDPSQHPHHASYAAPKPPGSDEPINPNPQSSLPLPPHQHQLSGSITSDDPSIPPIDTSSPEDHRVSFRTSSLQQSLPLIRTRFPNIEPLYLTKIFRGTIGSIGLIWLDIGRQDTSPLDFSDLAHLLYCFEIYGQIVCTLAGQGEGGSVQELELQKALADYKIRLLKMSKWATWESLLEWHKVFLEGVFARGQDRVEVWREGREDLGGILRRKM